MKKLFYLLLLPLLTLPASAQYHSLLWKISGNGLAEPSYLFGSMHTSDSRVKKMSDRAIPFFNESGGFAMELDPKEALDMSLFSKLMMGKNYSLKKMIPQAEYLLLDSVIRDQTGFSMGLLDNMAPVFIMTIFETAGMELSDSQSNEDEVLDLYLYDLAKEKQKPVIGIETADEQLSALNSLTYNEQADMLVHEVHEYERNRQGAAKMVQFYLEENLDSLANGNEENEMPQKFYKALVTDRNKRMANRIGDFIRKQSTFIAIGALHLPGEKGVIELLRKKGFLVEAVP